MSQMKDRCKLQLAFDVARMQKDLAVFDKGDWVSHFVEQNYEGDWSVIPLRGPATATHPVMMIYSDPSCTEFSDTQFLRKTRYLPEVLNTFQCPLLAVRLMKLTAGSQIKEHRDHDLAIENGTVRLHVPIRSEGDVEFRLNGSKVAFKPGQCWYLRLSDPHSVQNRGTCDRVHLVIDATVNGWLRAMLQR
jgi:mannose-6-phosphate isomerase-like protein (cupin superfamily)